MKIIKTIFLISLFNLFTVGSIVLAFKSDKNTVTPTAVLTIPTVDSRCIIAIDGVKYDISQYQYQHSGGNIFQCGTDMSAVFHNRHSNQFLQYMQQFRI